MADEFIYEFYENCVQSPDLYFEYASVIFEAFRVSTIEISHFLLDSVETILKANHATDC